MRNSGVSLEEIRILFDMLKESKVNEGMHIIMDNEMCKEFQNIMESIFKENQRLNNIKNEYKKGLIYTLEYIIDIEELSMREYKEIYKKATNVEYNAHLNFEDNIKILEELKENNK